MPEYQMALLGALPAVKRVVCIGDIHQLPPFSHFEENAPCGFLERAQRTLEARGLDVPLLSVQFRMHKTIAKFVSNEFYRGKITTDTDMLNAARFAAFDPTKLYVTGLKWLRYSTPHPLAKKTLQSFGRLSTHRFTDKNLAESKDLETEVSRSFINCSEICHVLQLLEVLLMEQHINPQKSVAVITFYKAQATMLRGILEDDDALKKLHMYGITRTGCGLGLRIALQQGCLRIGTVDSAQGSEANTVILSGVRSNASRKVGFLTKGNGRKRLCVAMSRAQDALIVVGSETMRAVRALDNLWRLGEPPKAEVEMLANAGDLMRDVERRRQADAESRALADFMGTAVAVSAAPAAAAAVAPVGAAAAASNTRAPARSRDLDRAKKAEEDFM